MTTPLDHNDHSTFFGAPYSRRVAPAVGRLRRALRPRGVSSRPRETGWTIGAGHGRLRVRL